MTREPMRSLRGIFPVTGAAHAAAILVGVEPAGSGAGRQRDAVVAYLRDAGAPG